MTGNFRTSCVAACALALALTGCSRSSDIKVQTVPKDASAPPAVEPGQTVSAPGQMDFHPQMSATDAGQIKWSLPSGWEEKPLSQMRVGSFNARGKDGQVADVSIIPLPASGREVDFVNMWRQQMKLPQEDAATANQNAQTVTIGGETGKLFDIASEQAILEGRRARMLVAMITRGGTSWFFKMTGENDLVGEQKPVFLQFLKDVSFQPGGATTAQADPHAGMAEGAAPMQPSDAAAPAPASWTVPAGWQNLPATEFLVARYEISGADGAKADVDAAVLGGTGGGVLANINRWRGQLSLPPITDADLPAQTSSLTIGGGTATMVDLTGTDKNGRKTRMIGVILPQGSQTWFYRLMGDQDLVTRQKDAFVQFMQSARYADAQ